MDRAIPARTCPTLSVSIPILVSNVSVKAALSGLATLILAKVSDFQECSKHYEMVLYFYGMFALVDVDECVEERHNCIGSMTCDNTIGSFTCSCPLETVEYQVPDSNVIVCHRTRVYCV